MNKMKPTVNSFFDNAKKWKAEMKMLRLIVLKNNLKEELKWYQPCYTVNNKNVLIISAFKEYCILGFFKGALIRDIKKRMSKPGENTQAVRQLRFTSANEIKALENTIHTYIREAVSIEEKGMEVKYKNTDEYSIPIELESEFKNNASFKKAFYTLTPGRQRAYLLHFSSAKQSQTRISRIEKYKKQILALKGLND